MAGMAYRSKMRWLLVLAYVAAAAVGLLVGRLAGFNQDGSRFWITFPVLLLVGSLTFVAVMPYWRRLDDMQRHGHMASWYWGGLAGTIVLVMWLAAAGKAQYGDFGRGAVTMFGVQFVGYAICFIGWRLRGRGPAE